VAIRFQGLLQKSVLLVQNKANRQLLEARLSPGKRSTAAKGQRHSRLVTAMLAAKRLELGDGQLESLGASIEAARDYSSR